jgi:hypothetical protein
MTLGAFAVAVGAPTKWVVNAHAVLGVKPDYSVARARLFALTRTLEQGVGLPLKRAYDLASLSLAAGDGQPTWRLESPDGVVTLVVDRKRFLSDFAARLSRARVGYVERKRGRPPRKRRRGLSAARHHGVDLSLVRASLHRSPAARLQNLDADVAFLQKLKVSGR